MTAIGWNKPLAQYERYRAEQRAGTRDILVATVDGEYAGYVTVRWESPYEPFGGIPEIQDFNVLPKLRRRGIGSALMDAAENLIGEKHKAVGIRVGLTADYGAAHRIYVKRGYLPDGRGLTQHGEPLKYGDKIIVTDDLNLSFTKELTS